MKLKTRQGGVKKSRPLPFVNLLGVSLINSSLSDASRSTQELKEEARRETARDTERQADLRRPENLNLGKLYMKYFE